MRMRMKKALVEHAGLLQSLNRERQRMPEPHDYTFCFHAQFMLKAYHGRSSAGVFQGPC